MRPIAEVVRAIWNAWWTSALGSGGTIQSRFSAKVERIIGEERQAAVQPDGWDKPSEQTTVVELRRRDLLLAEKARAASQSRGRRQAAGSGGGSH